MIIHRLEVFNDPQTTQVRPGSLLGGHRDYSGLDSWGACRAYTGRGLWSGGVVRRPSWSSARGFPVRVGPRGARA